MSTTEPDLRPARTTPNLELPVPGDAGPADYVTDTGAICDRLDALPGVTAPVVTALPTGARVGDEIYLRVGAVLWQLRYGGGTAGWEFLGGGGLRAEENPLDAIGPVAWTRIPPNINVPAIGEYSVEFGARAFQATRVAFGWSLGVVGSPGAGAIPEERHVAQISGGAIHPDTFTTEVHKRITLVVPGLTLPVSLTYNGVGEICGLGFRYIEVTPRRIGVLPT